MKVLKGFLTIRISENPNLQKILRNISWLFLDKIVRMGVGLMFAIWLARYLGPEQFGLLNYSIAFVGIFGVLAGLGLQHVVVRELVRNPREKEKTLGSAALLLLLSGILVYGLTVNAICWIRPESFETELLIAVIGTTILFKVGDVALFWFESKVESKGIVVAQNIAYIAFVLLKILLIVLGSNIIFFGLAIAAEGLTVACLSLVIMYKSGALKTMMPNLKNCLYLANNSWPLLVSSVAVVAYMKIDLLMLGQISGDKEVGIYSAAVRMSEVWYFIPLIIIGSLYPSILKSKNDSPREYSLKIKKLYSLMIYSGFAISVVVAALSNFVTSVLYGNGYSGTGAVLAIHVCSMSFVFLGVATNRWLIAEGMQKTLMLRSVFGLIVNVGMNYLLIPGLGAVGAATASVVTHFSVTFVFDIFSEKTRRDFFVKMRACDPRIWKVRTIQ